MKASIRLAVALAAAFSAAGFAADRFLFVGFLPSTQTARVKALSALEIDCPLILYEAPHRVLDTVHDLAERFGGEREIAIARELTKKFEEVARMQLGAAAAWLGADPQRIQGEFVLVVAAGPSRSAAWTSTRPRPSRSPASAAPSRSPPVPAARTRWTPTRTMGTRTSRSARSPRRRSLCPPRP